MLLGQYLLHKRNEKIFRKWLKENCGANVHHTKLCFDCLTEWCEAFI